MGIIFKGDFTDIETEGLTKLVKVLKKNVKSSKDIVHFHSGGFFLAKQNEKKAKESIYTLYSNIDFQPFKKFFNLLEQFMHYTEFSKNNFLGIIRKTILSTISSFIPMIIKRKALAKFKVVVVPTEYQRKQLKLTNVKVIPFGIDVKKFKPSKSKQNKFIVAYLGHRGAERGIPDIVKAFALIKDQDIEKRMYLTKHCPKIEKKLSKIPNCKLFGKVSDIVKVYNECDVVVLPYRTTSATIANPLVLLEAMACGTNVVTTDIPHIKEICQDSVEYVKPRKAEQIVNAIKKLKNNKKLASNLASKAKNIVSTRYNEEAMIKKYNKLYSELGN